MRIRVSVHCICQTSVDHLLNVHTVVNHRSSYVVMCFIDMLVKCDILLVGVFMLTRYHRKWRIHFQTAGEWCNVIFADVDFMRYNINRTIESSKAQVIHYKLTRQRMSIVQYIFLRSVLINHNFHIIEAGS